jgi:hypothetical protein
MMTQNLYKQLLRASRQWRDLKNRMDQGLGHQPENTIPDGCMAVFCPACPQPGVNLPKDWNTRYQPYVVQSWLHLSDTHTIVMKEPTHPDIHHGW